jgi:hypothetical protein
MVSTIATRPSHYKVLGVGPRASREEIARAFAREVGTFRPRAFGGLTELSIAYETLRDPVKRRAYDTSIGIEPEPEPIYSPPREGVHLTGSAQFNGLRLQRPAPPAAERPLRDPPVEPEATPFIIARLHELAEPQPKPRPEPEAILAPEPPAEIEGLPEVEGSPIAWQRPALAAGALIAAAVLVGGLAGSWSGNAIEPEEAGAAVTAPLPRAKAEAVPSAAALPAPVPLPRADTPRQANRVERRASPKPPSVSADRLAEVAQTLQAPAPTATGQAVIEPAVAEPADSVAAMPLSNKAIARTMRRIGYACGRVTSTAAVEGAAPGVFRVTCTSGYSYQATPVRGRYRFRRLGRN